MTEINPSDYSTQETEKLIEICAKNLGFNSAEHFLHLETLRRLVEHNVDDIRETIKAVEKSPNPTMIFDRIRDSIRLEMVKARKKN